MKKAPFFRCGRGFFSLPSSLSVCVCVFACVPVCKQAPTGNKREAYVLLLPTWAGGGGGRLCHGDE
eukprot:1827237-Rhodomonas_salina.1